MLQKGEIGTASLHSIVVQGHIIAALCVRTTGLRCLFILSICLLLTAYGIAVHNPAGERHSLLDVKDVNMLDALEEEWRGK